MRILAILYPESGDTDNPHEVIVELSDGAARLMHATPAKIVEAFASSLRFTFAGRAQVGRVVQIADKT
jgi:hypothetical protein